MKQLLMWLMLLLACAGRALAQGGEIYGTITDETNQPFYAGGVTIIATQGGLAKGGAVTNDDGSYSVKQLRSGAYDVEFRGLGYATMRITNVKVDSGGATKLNCKLVQDSGRQLKAVMLASRRYSKPLVNKVMVTTSAQGVISNVSPRNRKPKQPNTESYRKTAEQDFRNVLTSPLSTMSVDVDHASYANVRRFINEGTLPPAEAVRVEEMINYFDYHYPQPEGQDPIAIQTETIICPWNQDHLLLRIGMQAQKTERNNLPPSNIVFLIDVSGSMTDADKLPLLKDAFRMLTNNLRAEDHVSIVVYAGRAGLVLPYTSGSEKKIILDVIDKLEAGGSTAGGEGIRLAYRVAQEHFIEGGNNRVILATDGDFNVGVSSDEEMEKLIVQEREKGIFLSCLGFGYGNYKDSKMEVLADKGNGNYNYIDNVKEAHKTLVKEFGGTLFTVAKDVKSQIEFNPKAVKAYRLIGYDNRILNAEDFKNDKKDAGDMGSGHNVTILYELVPATSALPKGSDVDSLKYQHIQAQATLNELATIKFRYKLPSERKSKEMVYVIPNETSVNGSSDTKFAAAVALFGMLLQGSAHSGTGSYEQVIALAQVDADEYKKEFTELAQEVVDMKKDKDE